MTSSRPAGDPGELMLFEDGNPYGHRSCGNFSVASIIVMRLSDEAMVTAHFWACQPSYLPELLYVLPPLMRLKCETIGQRHVAFHARKCDHAVLSEPQMPKRKSSHTAVSNSHISDFFVLSL